ncbi:MAG: alpha/beta hydrolase [Pseudomonadota bacterium]
MNWVLLMLILAVIALPYVIEIRRSRMSMRVREDAPGKFAQLSQGVTHYQWVGPKTGPVILCVHGLTSPSFVWKALAKGLAVAGYRVLTYDLYGRGYSDRPKGPQNRLFFRQQIEDLLEHEGMGERKITLIGYSMGGAISTIYAADNPDRVARLILLAPAGMGMVARGFARFIAVTPVVGDWIMYLVYPDMLRKSIKADYYPGISELQEKELDYRGFLPAVLASLRGVLAERLGQEHRVLASCDIPVLAIWGEDDTVIPLTAMGQLAEWNRKARQDVIEGASHGVTYTHGDQVLGAITAFLAEDL